MLRRLLITGVVLVLLLVVADRVAVHVAQNVAADNLKSSQHLTSTPSVDIAGFPFLTQLASGDFDRITVDANAVPVGSSARVVQLAHLHVVLRGVSVTRSFSRVHADRADATARIGYAELSKALGVQVTYAGSGRVRATASLTVLGRKLSGSITAHPELHGSALGFGGAQLAGAGSLAAELSRLLRKVFDVEIPLADVPFQVRVTSLEATASGLQAAFAGQDLSYQKS